MKRIIIIGAGGYLGAAVTQLARKTYKVIATFRNRPCPITSTNIDHVQLDFSIKAIVEGFQNIIQNTDLVVIASNVEYGQPDDLTSANYKAFLRTLSTGGIKCVYVSSDAVFDGQQLSYTEESVPIPITDYGKRKLEAERIIGNGSNLIIRTSYLYGTNGFTSDKRLLELQKAAREGKTVFHHKPLIRNPIHVSDLANAIMLLHEKNGVFHVAGPTMLVHDFYRCLAEEVGINISINEEKLTKEEADSIPINTNLVSIKLPALGITIPSMEENRGRIYLGSRANNV